MKQKRYAEEQRQWALHIWLYVPRLWAGTSCLQATLPENIGEINQFGGVS